MHYVIYGAGGIGATIGARLHQLGEQVTLIARGAHKEALQKDGLTFVSPDGVVTLKIPTIGHPGELTPADDLFVMLCMKSQHTEEGLRALAEHQSASLAIACVQNGVGNERLALRYFEHVYATVVNLPALHLRPGEVVTHAAGVGGILDTGCYPGGVDERAEIVTAALTQAGFSAMPDAQVMRQKYAKLLMNLGNVVQAGISDKENVDEILRGMRNEALACYAAAGIDCATRDEVRGRRESGYRMADIPGYPRGGGSSWQSIERGTGDIETEYLNGEISLLGRLHNVPTPYNDAGVQMARVLIREGSADKKGPGIFSVTDFKALMN